MKIKFLILSGMMVSFIFASAQPGGNRQNQRDARLEKMQEIKKSMLSEKLKLTEQEALKFWPIYDEFTRKMDEQKLDRIKSGPAARNFRGDLSNKSDKEIEEIIQSEFKSEEEMLKLKREYHEKFKATIGIKRTAEFYAAEMEFRRKMMREMQSRSESRVGGRP